MTVPLGLMEVPAPVDGDSIRRYETGTLPDGGLWTALRRLSDHDHTGGTNGAPISVSSIPDGSITTSKLDPSVLAPYALVDGSKPFTGQVTMQADAILRDALYFGQQGSANPPDTSLIRSAAGVIDVAGTGQKAWMSFRSGGAPVAGRAGQPVGGAAGAGMWVSGNADYDGTNWNRDAVANPAAMFQLGTTDNAAGALVLNLVTARAAANPITWVSRLNVSNVGTVVMNTDAGQPALLLNGSAQLTGQAGQHTSLRVDGPAGFFKAMNITEANALMWQWGVQGDAANDFNLWSYPNGLLPFKVNRISGTTTLSPASGQGALMASGMVTVNRPEAGGDVVPLQLQRAGTTRWNLALDGNQALTFINAAGGYKHTIAQNGTLTLTGDGSTQTSLQAGAGQNLLLASQGGASVSFAPSSNYVFGQTDAAYYCGHPSWRWAGGFTATGFTVGSSRDLKEDIAPLDPARAMDAVRATEPVTFTYTAPVKAPEWYDLPDDPEEAERRLYDRLTAEPLAAAARQQAGFLAEQCDPLLLVGAGQTNPSHTAGVLLAALRNIDQRLQALETP